MDYLPRNRLAALAAILLAATFAAFSDEPKETPRVDTVFNLEKDGLAIQGYDPVAYFQEGGGKPAQGRKDVTHTIGRSTYRFASEANRDLFQKNPEKYEPAYGGWCAYAMGTNGEKVEINPKAFVITDNKLYLFYKTFITDTRKPWNKNEDSLKPKADASWNAIVEKAAEAGSSDA